VDAIALDHTGLQRGLYEPIRVDDPYSPRAQLPLDARDVCLMLGRGYAFAVIVIREDAQNDDPGTLGHGTSNPAQYAGAGIAADPGIDYAGCRSFGLQHGLQLCRPGLRGTQAISGSVTRTKRDNLRISRARRDAKTDYRDLRDGYCFSKSHILPPEDS
jgi:hypothetical protein